MATEPRLPNCFLVGAMKAGTTTIARALDLHPEVFVSPIKEPNHFCTDLYEYGLGTGSDDDERVRRQLASGHPPMHAFVREPATYRLLFEAWSSEKVLVDCSTTYLYSRSAPQNIAAACPEAKIVISLRNPIDRAFSEYLLNRRDGAVRDESFAWCLDEEQRVLAEGMVSPVHRYVTAGRYGEQVGRYLELFGRERVFVVRFERLTHDPDAVMQEIFAFLEVQTMALPPSTHENAALSPRWAGANAWLERSGLKRIIRDRVPIAVKDAAKRWYYGSEHDVALAESERARLRKAFESDVRLLSELLGQDFSNWLH